MRVRDDLLSATRRVPAARKQGNKMRNEKESNQKKNHRKLTVQDIALMGMMVAVIEVCKATLSFLPNVELTSFWLIMFTLYFGWKIVFVVPVFIMIEGFIYGIHLWWIMYLYVWPLLVFLAWLFRKKEDVWFWSYLSAGFGLSFGFLCSLVYLVIGATEGGMANGFKVAFAWWISGIPWDIVHGVANFVIMLVLYKPIKAVMNRLPLQKRRTG